MIKKVLLFVLAALLTMGCSTMKVLVGDVSVYNQLGERKALYQDAIIHDEGVREGEVLSNLSFMTTGEVEHYVEGTVVVNNLRWVDGYSTRTTYVVYPYYNYYRGYRYYDYYGIPPRARMAPPPPPRPAPRVQPQPAPRSPGGSYSQPPHGGRRR